MCDVPFSLELAEKMRRWKFVMIFLLGNTLLCIVVTTILNIVDSKRVTVFAVLDSSFYLCFINYS